jgi:uncharacterized protein (TIGR02996 family)
MPPFQNPDFLSLQRQVHASYSDDAPRLILADWLEENDEGAWADFIRLQCRLRFVPNAYCSHPRFLDCREGGCGLCAGCKTQAVRSGFKQQVRAAFRRLQFVDAVFDRASTQYGLMICSCDYEEYCNWISTGDSYHAALFDRGFADRCCVSFEYWLTNGDRLTATVWPRVVRLRTWPVVEEQHDRGLARHRYRLRCRQHWSRWYSDGEVSQAAVDPAVDEGPILLASEWPSVEFELPDLPDGAIRSGGWNPTEDR